MEDPAGRMRAWLPHALLLLLVLGSVALLTVVVWPLRGALLLAGSVALLTWPVAFAPAHARLAGWMPHWGDDRRRFTAAAVATALVGLGAGVVFCGGLWLVLGRSDQVWDLLVGVALGDAQRLDRVLAAVVLKLDQIFLLYPALPFDARLVTASLRASLGQGAVGPDLLSWLFHGTLGVLGGVALTLVALFYLYAQGAQLAGMLLGCLPLTAARRGQLAERFHRLATYVAAGIVARALAHGLVCGLIAWAVAGANPLATGAVAAFLALLPIVGPALAWVPYATVLWSTGRQAEAGCLAVACLLSAWVIELLFRRLARHLGADPLWFGFLLFCGLVGGVASFGLRGLLIGPAAALTAAALFGFLPAVYGVGGDAPADDGEPHAPR